MLALNVVSNVPLVLVARHWVPSMPYPAWGWILLAWTSTLAGNLTLFGSVANVIVMQTAGPRGEIGFGRLAPQAQLDDGPLVCGLGGDGGPVALDGFELGGRLDRRVIEAVAILEGRPQRGRRMESQRRGFLVDLVA